MTPIKYLAEHFRVAACKEKPIDQRPYLTVYGYTKRAGAPTNYMVRLRGEKRWRRVYVLQFSNAGSLFVTINGEAYYTDEFVLREAMGRS
jgi:hypothetical protein